MQTVKAQPVLARAFVQALQQQPALRQRLRLVLVGDGPLRAECEAVLSEAGVADLAWFAGERGDVPDVMRGLDCFVLPSFAEGISNTILEAMSSGLPVIATAVGASPELVVDGVTGVLVPAGQSQALGSALVEMASNEITAKAMGRSAMHRANEYFSMSAMVRAYDSVYSQLLPAGGQL
jgi:glycosyltransferase involved in cell wall biosynthesis